MKNLFFLVLYCTSTSLVVGQNENSWLLGDKELQFTLPLGWQKDVYYGARECNCSGLLLDNDEWDKKDQVVVAIHPNSKKINSFNYLNLEKKRSVGKAKIGKRKYNIYETEIDDEEHVFYVRQYISKEKNKKKSERLNIFYGAYSRDLLEKNDPIVKSLIKELSFNRVEIPLKKKWWFVDDDALTYQVPNSWSVDPFISSSVCDCWGTIMDNGKWYDNYVGIVVYPSSQEAQNLPNRNQVWSYEFVPNGKERKISHAGINYLLQEGNMVDDDDNEVAWKLTSLNTFNEKQAYLTIHFWTKDQKQFENHIPTFEEILSTIKLKNLRYDFE